MNEISAAITDCTGLAISMTAYSDGILNKIRVTKHCINDAGSVISSRRRSAAVDNYLYIVVLDKRHGSVSA
jgi:hypothetical protein